VNIICTVTECAPQASITWRSHEYIGEDRLMISKYQTEAPLPRSDDIMTRAECLEYEERNGKVTTIVSRLHISNYSSSSEVTCSASDESFSKSIILPLLGKSL
jgi:hypothetical protein